MAQQINLHTPLLLQPQLRFSAQAMARALGLMAVVLLLFCVWVRLQQQAGKAEFDGLRMRTVAERAQLSAAIQALKQDNDPVLLTQQIARLRNDTLALQERLKATQVPHLAPGQRHSAALDLLARSLPQPAWITRLVLGPGQFEVTGLTLETGVLSPWIGQLAADPVLAGLPLSQVHVVQLGASAQGLQSAPPGSALRATALPVGTGWAFQISTASARGTGP